MSLICSRTLRSRMSRSGVAVAAEGIEIDRPAHAQHLARVAHDEGGADRFAFPAFAPDGGGQFDDGSQRFQRHFGIELPQLLGAEPFEMLAQVDKAKAVDVFRLALLRLDAVVDCHDISPGMELFGRNGFEQGQAHAFLSRRGTWIDVQYG